MNIAEAKEEIKRAVNIYNKKDQTGRYIFPAFARRPILLMGPPGIGKTAVAAQAAEECGVGFVSYSLTHHTRQSAVGLPRITEQRFQGAPYLMTEYTVSEIIASVYHCIEQQGHREGILFIDEINCVSETLTPVMLQFLQNKRFGTHSVPDGWMILAAGNPTVYNRSAKEQDVVTLDRVRLIEIQPDLDAWTAYARTRSIHPVILSYLQIHPDRFYLVRDGHKDRQYVTPRGWEDLSALITAYEQEAYPIHAALCREYLGDEKVASDFAAYYSLYLSYGEEIGITELISGNMEKTVYHARLERIRQADLDERLLFVNLLADALCHTIEAAAGGCVFDPEKQKAADDACIKELENVLHFCEEAFTGDRELLLLITSLAGNRAVMELITRSGSPSYIRLCEQLGLA